MNGRRYLVHANGICAGYALLSAVVVAMPRRPSTMSSAWTFFFLDQVFTYLILGAAAVSTEVLYLANKGDIDITWSAVCGSFAGFCHKASASVILTFVVVAWFALLSLVSSYKLFSRFDPPLLLSSPPNKAGLEIAAF
ncbi:CASP-like protein 2A1 [Linum perenne]